MAAFGEWGILLVVVAMLMAMLFMASVLDRYQAHRMRVGVKVRRLETGLLSIVSALDTLAKVPLSRELRITLRREILTRYQQIRVLYRRYPGVDEKIARAQGKLNGEGEPPSGGVGPIENEASFRQLIGTLDQLVESIKNADMLEPVPSDVRAIFCRELGERRAEVVARFHLVEAKRRENEGKQNRARVHLTHLMRVLRQRGPSTDFVRELFNEAQAALSALSRSQANAVVSASPGASRQLVGGSRR